MNHNAKLKYEAGGKWFSCLYAAIDANKRLIFAVYNLVGFSETSRTTVSKWLLVCQIE